MAAQTQWTGSLAAFIARPPALQQQAEAAAAADLRSAEQGGALLNVAAPSRAAAGAASGGAWLLAAAPARLRLQPPGVLSVMLQGQGDFVVAALDLTSSAGGRAQLLTERETAAGGRGGNWLLVLATRGDDKRPPTATPVPAFVFRFFDAADGREFEHTMQHQLAAEAARGREQQQQQQQQLEHQGGGAAAAASSDAALKRAIAALLTDRSFADEVDRAERLWDEVEAELLGAVGGVVADGGEERGGGGGGDSGACGGGGGGAG